MTDDSLPAASATPAGEPVPPDQPLRPVAAKERLAAVDLLRGVAVLGILAMNVYAFGLPFVTYRNPLLWGGAEGLDFATWVFSHIVFEQKFMSLFAILFGVGVVLLERRAGAQGQTTGKVYVRRQLWLLVFGMAHGYLIWFGDILFHYAVCGLLVYPFRRRSPRFLLVVGSLVLLVNLPLSIRSGRQMAELRETAAEAEALRQSGATPSPEQEEALTAWSHLRPFMAAAPADVEEIVTVYRDGSYGEIFKARAQQVFRMETNGLFGSILWRAGGLMLLGMALAKLGIATGERSPAFYRRCLAVGYGLGLPLVAWSAWDLTRHRFDPIYFFEIGSVWNYLGSVFVALGHLALVMLAYHAGTFAGLQARLMAVGRMAFTNYLAHSLLLTPVFYGYGLGLFGRVDRFPLLGVALAVWALQLAWSPVWLRHFRFGPAEWLWRSLTYWRLQPMRRTPSL